MSLFVVATPIGHPQDFSQRALETLRTAELIIGEELKVLRQTLKTAGVQGIPLDQLNEHSRPNDIAHFVEECRTKRVALVSDCGTPGFCDPGADLVAACHEAKVQVTPIPGVSSLMTLLSVSGVRLEQFLFYGFLPAKAELRQRAITELKKERRPFIILETPYRAQQLIDDVQKHFAQAHCVVGLNLTGENERVVRVKGRELNNHGPFKDLEPIVLVVPTLNA